LSKTGAIPYHRQRRPDAAPEGASIGWSPVRAQEIRLISVVENRALAMHAPPSADPHHSPIDLSFR
jgi:hypothetical protein